MSQTFSGRVNSVLYRSEDFYIVKFITDEGRTYTAKGYFPFQTTKVGTWISFEGSWIEHKTYGKQISVTRSPVEPSEWTDQRVDSVLSSNGVGPQIRSSLKVLATSKGCKLYDLVNSGDLSDSDLDEFNQQFVLSRWKSTRMLFEASYFLSKAGVPATSLGKIWSTLGDELEEKITSDPWVLVKVAGINFKQADEVAIRLGVSLDNPGRMRGAVLSAVSDVYKDGHSFAGPGQIVNRVNSMVPGSMAGLPEVAKAIKELKEEEQLVVERNLGEFTAIYDPWVAMMEEFCAKALVDRKSSATVELEKSFIESEITKWSDGMGISITDSQMKAAVSAITEPVSILTGLPGTGKTTTLQVVVSVLRDLSTPFLLVAPTGIAAKRVASVTGASASTIHRAFSASGFDTGGDRESTYVGVTGNTSKSSIDNSGEVWEYGPGNPYPAKMVIIDECSMVDLHMLYRIMQGTAEDCRIMFVGDPYQLPSVGAGDVLRNLVESKSFTHSHLTEIFRQGNTSGIVTASHDINAGRTPDVKSKDFKLVHCSSESEACEIIKTVATKLFEKESNFQVLSPRHGGGAGVTNLNEVIRMEINPPSFGAGECRVMGSAIREGDRIMVVKNDYDKGVYNGDVGKVSRIDSRTKHLELRIFSGGKSGTDLVVRYPYNKGPVPIRLAYAQTVHKCVHPDTLVETRKDGVIPIREAPDTGEILTPHGFKPYKNKVCNPESDSKILITRGGYSVTTTLDHGLDVWDGCGYLRREVGQASVGDWVRLKIGGPEIDRPLCPLPKPNPGGPNAVYYRTPDVLSEEAAEFLGLMVADGTVYNRGFRLAKRHEDVVDRFSYLVESLFGYQTKRTTIGRTPAAEVNSTVLADWVTSLGGTEPNNKHIPASVFRSPKRVQHAFLRGLFEDGTVNVRDGKVDHISWSTSSERCHNEVKSLLLRLGMVTHTTRVKPKSNSSRASFQVSIRGESILIFRENIGFVSSWKNSRMGLDTVEPRGGIIPISKQEAISLRDAFKDVLGASKCRNAVARGVLSRVSAKTVVESGVDHPVVSVLSDRLSYHHDRIRSLESDLSASMCVEVPDGNQFIQNGFSGWNCQGQEYDYVVLPILNSFSRQLQRNLIYTAVTRARKRVFLVGEVSALTKAVLNDSQNKRNSLLSERILTHG